MTPPRTGFLLPTLLACSLAANVVLAWRLARDTAPHQTPRALAPYAALGSYLAENNHISDLKWTEEQFAAFAAGVRATYDGRGFPLDEDAKALRDQISARVQQLVSAEQPDPAEEYFRMLRERENVSRTASGLHHRTTLEGEGVSPKASDLVVISYAARRPDGEKLPALGAERLRVRVSDLLPGLAEGVQLMKPGGKALIYLPAKLSFADGAWPANVPPGMPIGFFVELHEVVAE